MLNRVLFRLMMMMMVVVVCDEMQGVGGLIRRIMVIGRGD